MTPADVDLAAHVDCTISHTFADLGHTIGLGLGIVAGVAIVLLGRSPKAVEVGLSVATTVAGWGESLGGQFTREDSGRIIEGSPTTFYGPQRKAAACMDDRTACASPGATVAEAIPILGDIRRGWRGIRNLWNEHVNGMEILPSDHAPGAHPQSKIGDGSRTVSIDTWPAARKGDGVTPCDGKISSGIESIKIGGPRGRQAGSGDRSEVDGSMLGVVFVFDGVGAVLGGPADLAFWAAEQLGDLVDPRIADAIQLYKYSTGAARAFSRDPSFDPMTAVERVDRGLEHYNRVTGAPGQVENVRSLVSPPPPPETVFDPRTRRWVPAAPPPRLF